MKTKITTYVAAMAFAVFAFAGVSHAGFTIFGHGSNFTAFTGSQVADISYAGNGMRNTASSSRLVIASLDHTVSGNGLSVRVNGRHTGQQTTLCTVVLVNGAGAQVATNSQQTSVNNTTWTMFFPVLASGTASGLFGTVMCTVPGNGNSVIFGYETLVN